MKVNFYFGLDCPGAVEGSVEVEDNISYERLKSIFEKAVLKNVWGGMHDAVTGARLYSLDTNSGTIER